MGILDILRFIANHPLNRKHKFAAIMRFVRWQIKCRIKPGLHLYPFAEKSKIHVKKGLAGASGNLYCGLLEFEDMAFVLHALRAEDQFVDIGANIGSYTILAASEVGAPSTSVEPIPITFSYLNKNLAVNKLNDKVKALNIGMGDEKGVLKFTRAFDSINHVAGPDDTDTIDVPVQTFDETIQLDSATIVKIDVEGFETKVLNGMGKALASDQLKAIIIELNGSGSRYGFNEDDIHQKLLGLGFKAYRYHPFERRLESIAARGSDNTIYIRDIEWVSARVKEAKKFKILGNEF